MRTLIAVALILLAPATAAAQDPPDVVTGMAQPGTTTATLNGTVDPNGTATSYYFQYGTSTAYGLQSPTQSAGSGADPVTVQATISGLTASTAYHYRLVAVREGEPNVNGDDRTVTTTANPPNPAAPSISRLTAADKTPTSARLTARIDPNRSETTWRIEWGLTPSLGRSTPQQTIPTGDGAVAVSAPIDGLTPHTKIYWRVIASNAAGQRRSGTANFTTTRLATGITLSVFPETTLWNQSVSISGRVQGSGVSGLTVALQRSAFPYTAGYEQVSTARTSGGGDFRFASLALLVATRFRAVVSDNATLTSAEIGANVRARVGIRRTRKTRRSLSLAGRVQPGLPNGRATLQRRKRSGGWKRIRSRALRTASTDTSRYGFKVWRKRRNAFYRVRVTANDGGAHLGGVSRTLVVSRKRR